jgi:hypothetical protein
MLEAVNAQIYETIEAISLDKREAAKVTKKTTNKTKNTVEEITYVDAKLLGQMRRDAMKYSAELPALKKAKAALLEELRLESPVSNIITHTAQDIISSENDINELLDSGKSTLDIFNEQIKNKNGG